MNTTPPGAGYSGAGTHNQAPRAPWRFVRRERGRMIAGVATGMADAFHIDVVVMRVIWVVVAVASFGVGVAAYTICWLAFPSDVHPAPLSGLLHNYDEHRLHNAGFIAGLALLGLGLVIAFGEVFRPFRHGGNVVWATVLIGAGLAVLVLRHPDAGPDEPPAPPPWASGTAAPPDDDSTPDPGATGASPTPGSAPPASATATAPAATIAASPTPPIPPIPPSAWAQSAPWPVAPTPRARRPRPRPFLTPLTCSLLLIAGGVAALLDNNGTTDLTAAEILAGGLCVVGLALVLSAWFGRARGLVPLGILLLLVTLPAATIDVPLTGGTGDREYRPTSRSELHSKYEMGIGRLAVDLTGLPLTDHTTRVRAQLGIGELVIDVPSTVNVVARAHAGAGSIRLFGGDRSGWPTKTTRRAPGTGAGELDLDLRVGAGDIQVRRFDANGAETIFRETVR